MINDEADAKLGKKNYFTEVIRRLITHLLNPPQLSRSEMDDLIKNVSDKLSLDLIAGCLVNAKVLLMCL